MTPRRSAADTAKDKPTGTRARAAAAAAGTSEGDVDTTSAVMPEPADDIKAPPAVVPDGKAPPPISLIELKAMQIQELAQIDGRCGQESV